MQILCIESATNLDAHMSVNKGEIYNSLQTRPQGIFYRNIDMWHELTNFDPENHCHVSLFIDLPNEEGQEFKVKKEELIEI